ncbi:MAG: PorV/PorQ family protein [Candidatus Neomarinimicrobiota bacterium]
MKRARFLYYGVIVFLIAIQSGYGQIKKQAQTGFRFLENPVNAEVVGRGGFGITNLHNSSAIFWNPAGLGWISSGLDLSVHYTKGIADINQTSMACALSLGNIGVLAVSAIAMDYGTFYGTRRPGPGDSAPDWKRGYVETDEFSPNANAFGIAYARAVSDRFTFGLHFKLAHQDLGVAYLGQVDDTGTVPDSSITKKNYTITVPAVDVGAYYDFDLYGISFGASVMNISREVRYVNEPFPLPFVMKFGSSFQLLSLLGIDPSVHDLIVGLESRHGRDFGEKLHIGIEYRLLDTFIARTGYMSNYTERGATIGVGIHFRGIHYDYALQNFGVFGDIHLMSIGIRFGT